VSLRKRAIVAICLAGVNFLGFLALTTTIDARFIWPTILIPLMGGAYLLSLRCPKCGTPIYKRKATVFGETFSYWGGFVPRRCSRCGDELP
jgi:hypothetical protein